MTLSETAFLEAQAQVKALTKKPSNDDLLKLYAFYKQGSQGDVIGKRPSGFDFVGGAKYDAWAAVAGLTKEEAQQKYIALVTQLKDTQS